MSGGTCAVCQARAGQQCAGCKIMFYCGREHQRAHWPKHRSECRPVTRREDDTLGRHLVASRNISAGELIFKENPIVLEKLYSIKEDDEQGPKYISKPVCLGCMKPARTDCPCSGCGWPLCSVHCESSPEHQKECNLMRSKGYKANSMSEDRKFPDYVCIAPLRILLLPEEKRRKVFELQSHLETRQKTPVYNLLKTNVAGFLREGLGFADEYSEEKILEICAILDTNSFEVQPYNGLKIRGLYLLASMMAHDCTPNTRHAFNDANTMFVYATVDIKKGQIVTATYTNTFWNTIMRRGHLQTAKCFDCTCDRCSDPTELGTYVGAIVCTKCNQGKVISTDPLKHNVNWKCESCQHEMSAKQIDWGNQSLREEIEKFNKKVPKDFEAFLVKYKNILHPTNSHTLLVKYALSQIYGNLDGYLLSDLTEEQIEHKIDIVHDLLDVVKILEPGQSRMRALLLFDLQAAMAMQAKIDFDAERITKERAQEILGDAMNMLQEATQILRTEPGMESLLQERLTTLAAQLDISLECEPKVPSRTRLSKPPATADYES